ncbi:hypothetical protein ALC53_08516 [Atta colombica]|uniref:Uncharacterized protein n=1 Tax=Atta colombica TaxID=520822 RepID=A0A195B9G0_9HYME|nr:hypothetical protein ALC53_08516 [Atta colombica]
MADDCARGISTCRPRPPAADIYFVEIYQHGPNNPTICRPCVAYSVIQVQGVSEQTRFLPVIGSVNWRQTHPSGHCDFDHRSPFIH